MQPTELQGGYGRPQQQPGESIPWRIKSVAQKYGAVAYWAMAVVVIAILAAIVAFGDPSS